MTRSSILVADGRAKEFGRHLLGGTGTLVVATTAGRARGVSPTGRAIR